MSHAGFFDLMAPALDAIDRALSALFPDLARVLLYAAFAAWLSMWLYRLVSPQKKLRAVRRMTRAAQRGMLADDIELADLMRQAKRSLVLGGAQIWMTLWPTLLIAVPLLFLLSWMSNRFDARLPQTGAEVMLCVSPATASSALRSSAPLTAADAEGCRGLQWPQPDSIAVLSDGDQELLRLPLTHAIGVIHKRQWWNQLFGNPIGYLPPQGPFDEIRIAMPMLPMHPFGPNWARGWLTPFLIVMLLLSIALRWKWKLI